MNTNTKIITLVTATLIALAPTVSSAMSMSDGVFSWPTDYKTQKASEATSTFDGKIQNLKIKTPIKTKTQTTKRK